MLQWGHERRRWHPMSIRQIIAFSLTIAVALVALLVPLYVNIRLANDGPEQITTLTLFETVGPSIFVPLLIPVALTGVVEHQTALLRSRPLLSTRQLICKRDRRAKQVADTQAGSGRQAYSFCERSFP